MLAVLILGLLTFTDTNITCVRSSGGMIKENRTELNLKVDNGALLINNADGLIGSVVTFEQCIFSDTSGKSFGWNWSRVASSGTAVERATFPQVAIGQAPWGGSSTSVQLPAQLQSLSGLILQHEMNYEVADSDGSSKWDFTYDLWLTNVRPDGMNILSNVTDEIEIFMGWNADRDGEPLVKNALTDVYNNSYHYYLTYCTDDSNQPQACPSMYQYHQFRIAGVPNGSSSKLPTEIDLVPFLQYVAHRYNRPQTLWLDIVYLGNEIWDKTSGHMNFTNGLSFDKIDASKCRKEYDQCGGMHQGTPWSECCQPQDYCRKQTDFYSQCIPRYPPHPQDPSNNQSGFIR